MIPDSLACLLSVVTSTYLSQTSEDCLAYDSDQCSGILPDISQDHVLIDAVCDDIVGIHTKLWGFCCACFLGSRFFQIEIVVWEDTHSGIGVVQR